MAELKIENTEATAVGIAKEIDEGAYDLVFQAIQEDIYSFPIKSFTRETISNALDSIKEKNIALEILENPDKLSEHYRDGGDHSLLKDSKFQPDYYNKDHLHISDKDYVEVEYREDSPRDIMTIKDHGVGLGGDRLRGFFKIGFSTKREMKGLIGKFGAGSKSALATGVEYFTMTTVYNGYKTSFMIYKRDYEPITPKTENSKVEEWEVKLISGDTSVRHVYWEPTNEKNSVTVELTVKKHNKSNFIKSVEDQFQHFDNSIRFTKPSSLYLEGSDLVTSVLNDESYYESEHFIIPRKSSYTVPYILVDGIVYGRISWDELELESIPGSIAIKVKATDVDITQSREALKWTEKTKATILNAVKLASTEASKFVSESLNSAGEGEDLFTLVKTLNSVSSSNDPVLHNLIKFSNKDKLSLKYSLQGYKFDLTTEFLSALFSKFSLVEYTVRTRSNGMDIDKQSFTDWFNITNYSIVYAEEEFMSKKKLAVLSDKLNTTSILYIRPNLASDYKMLLNKTSYPIDLIKVTEFVKTYIMGKANILLDEEVFSFKEDVTEDTSTGSISGHKNIINYSKIRKLAGKILLQERQNTEVKTIYRQDKNLYPDGEYNYLPTIVESGLIKYEPTIEKLSKNSSHVRHILQKTEGSIVFYTQEERNLVSILNYKNSLLPRSKRDVFFQVSKDALKHVLNQGLTLMQYIRKLSNNNTITMGQNIRTYNTYKKIHEYIEKENIDTNLLPLIFRGYSSLPPEDFKIYNNYTTIIDGREQKNVFRYLMDTYEEDCWKDLESYFTNCSLFQDLLQTGKTEEIKAMSNKLFGVDSVDSINAYDSQVVNTVIDDLKNYAAVKPLLEGLPNPSKEQLNLIKELITFKQNKNDDI